MLLLLQARVGQGKQEVHGRELCVYRKVQLAGLLPRKDAAGGVQLTAVAAVGRSCLPSCRASSLPPATCLQVWAQVCAQLADGLAGGPADLGVGVAHTLHTQHGGGLGKAPRRV